MATRLLLCGVPGGMCREIASLVAEPAWSARFALEPVAGASPSQAGQVLEFYGTALKLATVAEAIAAASPGTIIIDFTAPSAALENARLYCAAGVPFVMGTTGFERTAAVRLVEASQSCAVIAPNMAAPIVLLHAALRMLAETYPGGLSGYRVSIRESHQSGKKDTSGTAKAFARELQALTGAAEAPGIDAVRDPEAQRDLGVPEEFLGGHGFHWYKATSACGDVALELSHRVHGRRAYAEGTLLAAEFLAARVSEGARGRAWSMEDVLRGS